MNRKKLNDKNTSKISIDNEVNELDVTVEISHLDFSKALDRIDHYKLLVKMRHFGLGGSLLKVIASYLQNRVQQLRVGNCLSD